MNCIYAARLYRGCLKIGSTKSPQSRFSSFKTTYFSENDEPLQFKIWNVSDNCYKIDNMLKQDRFRGFIRYADYNYNNIGTEFYKLSFNNISLLTNWFEQNDIEYKEININKTTTMHDVSDILEKSTVEFINILIHNGIETEEDYRNLYSPYDIFPIDPENTYINFRWNMLLQKKYYSYDECKYVISKLESKILSSGCITDLQKMSLIHSLDNKIPNNLIIYYRKPLHKINNIIFPKPKY
jgi:hypothetical protein